MLTHDQIAELETLDAAGAPILSVYLDLDAAAQVGRTYRVAFDGMVKEARERLDEPARAGLAAEASRVHALLERERPQGKGLVVFSSTPRGLWEAHFLATRVMTALTFSPRAHVAPLLQLIDAHDRYAVALVDKATARLLVVFAGEIEERDEFTDEMISRHGQGGWSQAGFQRHHETHVLWHVKHTAQRLADLHRRRRFDQLILAGSHDATVELRRLLPRALADRVVANVPAAVTASDHEILEKTLAVERDVRHAASGRLLTEILDNAGPGGRGTVGLAPTLAALWSDLVLTLVVADGLRLEGRECPQCGRLDAGASVRCPTCEHEMRPVDDLVRRAMGRAIDQGANVDVVHDEVAQRLMERGKGFAALLRYPTVVPEALTQPRTRSA